MEPPIIIKKNVAGGPLGGRPGARVAIPGVLPSSSRFGEQVVKLRVPSLDQYIGGGIPIGSVCVIREDFPSRFADLVLKSFVADGATYNHRLYIATGKTSAEDFAKDLPSIKKSAKSDGRSLGEDEDMPNLKIAWRYGQGGGDGGLRKPGEQHLPSFDFNKRSSIEDLGGKHVILSGCDSTLSFGGNDILREILSAVSDLDVTDTSKPMPTTVARLAISHCEEQVLEPDFMRKLRAIVHHTNCCAVITISNAALSSFTSEAVAQLEHLTDIVISLQVIVEDKRRSELGGIDGVCEIRKAASVNTLKVFEPPKDIGFSFKKKRLLFHELDLPPEGETTTQRETSSKRASTAIQPSSTLSSSSCGSSLDPRKSLDF